jgi:small basic protein
MSQMHLGKTNLVFFFNNVPAGIHIVYINDKMGGLVCIKIVVVGVPKFSHKWR